MKLVLKLLMIFCLFFNPFTLVQCQELSNRQKIIDIVRSNLQLKDCTGSNYAIFELDINKQIYFNSFKMVASSQNQDFNNSIKEALKKSDRFIFEPMNEKIYYFLFTTSKADKLANQLAIVDISPFFKEVEKQSDAYLKSLNYSNPAFINCEITVDKNGKIINKSILTSSEDKYFNNIVLYFIDHNLKVPPLPDGINSNLANIDFTFTINQQSIDYSQNIQSAQSKIMKNLKFQSNCPKSYAKVVFRTDRAGNLVKQQIVATTGDSAFNNSIFNAVKMASPFESIGKNCAWDHMDYAINIGKSIPISKMMQNDGKKFLGTYTRSQQLEIRKYMIKQRLKIGKNIVNQHSIWSNNHIIEVSFIVNKEGTLVGNLAINNPSSDKEYNRRIIDAIRKTKFDSLPAFINENQIYLRLNFY